MICTTASKLLAACCVAILKYLVREFDKPFHTLRIDKPDRQNFTSLVCVTVPILEIVKRLLICNG